MLELCLSLLESAKSCKCVCVCVVAIIIMWGQKKSHFVSIESNEGRIKIGQHYGNEVCGRQSEIKFRQGSLTRATANFSLGADETRNKSITYTDVNVKQLLRMKASNRGGQDPWGGGVAGRGAQRQRTPMTTLLTSATMLTSSSGVRNHARGKSPFLAPGMKMDRFSL